MLVLQIVNIGFSVVFFGLFCWRLFQLRSAAETSRYSNYYPKLRILFSVLFIVFGVALLTINIFDNVYPEWYTYLFEAGGGQCINSITLLLQLFVLRVELNKEIPYTPFHIFYFFYLFLIELARLVFNLIFTINNREYYAQLTISIFLFIDATVQMSYWFAKKQSLPKFQSTTPTLYDQFKAQSRNLAKFNWNLPNIAVKYQIIANGSQIKEKMLQETFPYLTAHVTIKSGKIHMLVQTKQAQYVSDGIYTKEQIMELYSACGRLTLSCHLQFSDTSLLQLSKTLQNLLEQLLNQKEAYQKNILSLLRINYKLITLYERLWESRKEHCNCECSACFVCVHIDRHLWVHDHYRFYLRVQSKKVSAYANRLTQDVDCLVYPMKRFSDFEEMHERIKKTIPKFILPQLPKKHLFLASQSQIILRRNALQNYLQKLANDQVLLRNNQAKQILNKFLNINILEGEFPNQWYEGLNIKKQNIFKTFVEGDYVTFYLFTLQKNQVSLGNLRKRFNQFVELHQEIVRWKANIEEEINQYNFALRPLPQKHLFKSQAMRHQDLKNYLQELIQIKQISKVHAVNKFFNCKIYNRQNQSSSFIRPLSQQNKKNASEFSHEERFSIILEELARSHI